MLAENANVDSVWFHRNILLEKIFILTLPGNSFINDFPHSCFGGSYRNILKHLLERF